MQAIILYLYFYSTDHETRKISSGEEPVVSGGINQDAFHQASPVKPMLHRSFCAALPFRPDSDSGYGSTASSGQRIANEDDRLQWISPGKRMSPSSSPFNLAPKRVRIQGKAGEPITRTRSVLGDKSNDNDTYTMADGAEKIFTAQKLDINMVKAHNLRGTTAMHYDRSEFRQGSPLAPSESSSRQSVNDVHEQHQSDTRRMLQENRIPKTISPKLIGLDYHENAEAVSVSPPLNSYSLFEENVTRDLRNRTPQHAEHQAERHTEHTFPLDGDLWLSMKPLERQRLWPEQRMQDMLQHQSGEQRTNSNIAPTNFSSDQTDFTCSDSHDRFGYDFPVVPNDAPTKDQSGPDEKGHSKPFDRAQPIQNLMMWSSSAIDNTTGGAIEPSRGIIAMNQDPAPRIFYRSQRQGGRGSGRFYGSPATGSRISSISEITHPESLARPGLPFICHTCQWTVETESELKKHKLRHDKPFKCDVTGCPRREGYTTADDLEWHIRSKHPGEMTRWASNLGYVCPIEGCKSLGTTWPRQDNFRSHLKRTHHETEVSCMEIIKLRSNDVEPSKRKTQVSTGSIPEDSLDLQSLHVLADSAVIGDLLSLTSVQRAESMNLSPGPLPKAISQTILC